MSAIHIHVDQMLFADVAKDEALVAVLKTLKHELSATNRARGFTSYFTDALEGINDPVWDDGTFALVTRTEDGTVVGWCLVEPRPTGRRSMYGVFVRAVYGVFVRPDLRRRGIGRKLADEARRRITEVFGHVEVYGWYPSSVRMRRPPRLRRATMVAPKTTP